MCNTESPFEKDRGRTRGARRRLTEYTITLPETSVLSPVLYYGGRAGSEDSNSEHSFTSYNSSPCRELLCDSPVQHQPPFPQSSPRGSYASQQTSPQQPSFYHNPRHQSSPCFHKGYSPEEAGVYPPDVDPARGYYGQRSLFPPSNRYGYWPPQDGAVSHYQRAPRPFPSNAPPRLSPSPSAHPEWDRPHYQTGGLSPQLVSEQLKSWHRRSQLRTPRSRSLDRQGAVRLKNPPAREPSRYQNHKYSEQVSEENFNKGGKSTFGCSLVDDKSSH